MLHVSNDLQRRTGRRASTARRGFSIVELLVVVAIIVALLSILIVALGLAAKRATAANTQFLLGSITKGVEAFKADMGYLPPVLGRNPASGAPAPSTGIGLARDFVPPPRWLVDPNGIPSPASIAALQDWYSYTSIAEYLLGYGDRFADGYGAMGTLPAASGTPGAKEVPLLGMRSPGTDGVWNAVNAPLNGAASANGRYAFRNVGGFAATNASAGNATVLSGKVSGPYLELKDDALLGGITGFDAAGEPIVVRPGEVSNFDALPKVVLDYWGNPIQYYRRPFDVAGTPSGNFWSSLNSADPKSLEPESVGRDLGDLIALRPFDFKPGEDAIGVPDADGDTSTLGRYKAARFAVMSRGPDRKWDKNRRRDNAGDDPNKDNLVEVGQ
jgi:prepilin-type N-terminal cleavage/methylation domain-containing protein